MIHFNEYETYLFNQLSSLGNFVPLELCIEEESFDQQLHNINPDWKIYNKNKPNYRREGLSLFSLNGETDGLIDLNSVAEYNKKNNTSYNEMSFNTPTKYWREFTSISSLLEPIEAHIGRSHFIKLDEGGFFPPHRDLGSSIRLISFLNCDYTSLNLTLDENKVLFNPERIYFLNTRHTHSLFSFKPDSIILVLNLKINEDVISFILNNLQAR